MSSYLKRIVDKLTPESRGCLDAAVSQAISRTHHEVDVEHLLLAIIIRHSATQQTLNSFRSGNSRAPVFSSGLIQWLEKAWLHASARCGDTQLAPPALLACLLDAAEELLLKARQHAEGSALLRNTTTTPHSANLPATSAHKRATAS